ncbi:MAG: acetate kinase [Spirochaetaceae bacterium]|nr:acetate kinase [Spirochaetaceae bacterium]
MNILVLNSGSSSIKYNLWEMNEKKLLCKGLVEKIGMDDSSVTFSVNDKKKTIQKVITDYNEGIELILDIITDKEDGVLKNIKEIDAVGHRIVHGGEKIIQSELVTPEIKKIIDECALLAPLHNPHNLEGIVEIEKVLPGVPNVAVFDTAFHSTMPPESFIYPLPYEFYEKHKIRRYGFHGTSHKYVSLRGAELLKIWHNKFNCITCHFGNGASIAAIKNGISVDTTMGFTPLAGLPMGTRTGNIDPSIILYMIQELGYTPEEVSDIINKKSGFLGISGISSDMREIREAATKGDEKAILTLKIFSHSAKRSITAMTPELDGRLDAIIFTGGIGENSPITREMICQGLSIIGAYLDVDKNNSLRGEGIISKDDSPVKIMLIPTNEELMIALETQKLVGESVYKFNCTDK